MNEKQIIIPDGWTYFAHRTNTARWKNNPFDEEVITISRLMSVVTESDAYQELSHYGQNYLHSYTSGEGEPFEIRCLICNLSHLHSLDANNEKKEIMLKQFYYDKMNFGGAYGMRHHSIPKGEELVVMGIGNYDEVFDRESKIIWTIPKRFVTFYQEEVKRGNIRMIDIQRNEETKKNNL